MYHKELIMFCYTTYTLLYIIYYIAPEANHIIFAKCYHPILQLRWIKEITTNWQKKRIQNICINEIDCIFKIK